MTDTAALATELGVALAARGATCVTAESCTGGLVAAAITAVAGSSGWFERGFVTYSNDAKVELLGVPAATIAAGLATFRPAAGRLRRLTATSGATLIDDSYNANPDSVRAAIDVLAQYPAPRVLVLGDMGEVGDQGPAFHAEVGAYAKSRGIDRLLAFGPAGAATAASFGDGAEHLPTIEDTCWRATKLASAQATVLVKGSRSMRMERVVQALSGAAGDGGHH